MRWFVLIVSLLLPSALPAQHLTQAVILVARPGLADPLFAESVVLVTRHGGAPPLGLILNRPLPRPAAGKSMPPFIGGPVMPEQVFFLAEQEGVTAADLLTLGYGIFMGSGESTLSRLRSANPPPRQIRRFAGYAGWGPGQLDNEINRGDWTLLPFDPGVLFREDVTRLWQELRHKAGRRAI